MSDVVDLTPLNAYLETVAQRGRTMLLPALHHAQSLYGWLPTEVQRTISFALRVPLADVHGVIEFYTMFYNEPTAKRVIRVCEDVSCSLNGGNQLAHEIAGQLGLKHGETTADGSITFEVVPCLGMCELAPCALNGDVPAGDLTHDDIPAFIAGQHPEPAVVPNGDPAWLTARIGRIDPLSLDAYKAHGGYTALPNVLATAPDAFIETIESFGILGRGGAQFPLGRKWAFTRSAAGTTKHIICNADESETGTFKDRTLMEGDPFALIEGMTLAAHAVGAANGWIFIRGEYPRAAGRLQNAIDQARAAGYLGDDILGSGLSFDIEVRLGAGAYICGEETALMEAIEGKRGFPRIKPPYPTTNGLFDQPSAINNVETFVTALTAYNLGADKWNSVGTEKSPGTRLFCLSGHVVNPGVYEVPFGTTLGDLVTMAGGVADGKQLQAILMGGAAGKFVTADKLTMPLTYEDAQEQDVPLGSGVVLLFDETVDLRRPMYELARFFAHESCGKCFPCQLGSQRQMEILDRIQRGGAQAADKQILLDLSLTMTETSLCGLGQTAGSAVTSAIELFPAIVE